MAKLFWDGFDLCGFKRDWSAGSIIDQAVANIRATVGDAKVVCALSGGVDSSVAATLVDKAIGKQQTCIFVDTGLLRQNEYSEVLAAYKSVGLNVKPIRAATDFYDKLKMSMTQKQNAKSLVQNLLPFLSAKPKPSARRSSFLYRAHCTQTLLRVCQSMAQV